MSEIESIKISEFKEHLEDYTTNNQNPIALTNHGETIGYYIPAQPKTQQKDLELLRESVRKLNQILAEKGLSKVFFCTPQSCYEKVTFHIPNIAHKRHLNKLLSISDLLVLNNTV